MKNTRMAAVLKICAIFIIPLQCYSAGFTVTLYDGTMYGPGNLGIHDINGGYLKNFVVTSALTGTIEFFNNGGTDPNVFAEKNHTGDVDGKLSDGTKINENVDAAFVIEVDEPETKQPIQLFICSVSEEIVEPDEKGNLLFKLHAAFDTGFADDVIQIPVQFTTGWVEIPLSDKTQRGLPLGNDQAGPFSAGTNRVGRLGDIDQDGFLDGVFVLAGNTPPELIIVEGDPVFIYRPFKSDIPVSPQEALFYEVNGIVQNFPDIFKKLVGLKNTEELRYMLGDIQKRLQAAEGNLNAAGTYGDRQQDKSWIQAAKSQVNQSKLDLSEAIKKLNHIEKKSGSFEKIHPHLDKLISVLNHLHNDLVKIRGRFI